MVADLGLKIVTFQPFRDFEGMPEPQRQPHLRARRAQVRPDGRTRLRPADDLQQCLAGFARRHRPRRGRFPRTRRARGEARHPGRLRGAGLGHATSATTATPGRWCGAPTIRRSGSRSTASISSRARPTSRRSARSRPTGSCWCSLPTRRGSTWTCINWSRHFRCFPGQGDFPLIDFMDAVLATGYNGMLSLEIFNDQFRAGSPRGVAVDGQRSLVYLMDQMRDRAGALAPGRAADSAAREMPRHRVHRIRRRRPHRRRAGASCSAGLGFRKVGEHKSKAVTRWSQGAINLVLNSEKEGFAHSHQLRTARRSARCASRSTTRRRRSTAPKNSATRRSGRRSGRANWKFRRCAGLAAACFISSIRHERDWPRLWDIDFIAPTEPQADGKDAGLTAVDHISQSMHYEEMLSWLLFYNSLLDVD